MIVFLLISPSSIFLLFSHLYYLILHLYTLSLSSRKHVKRDMELKITYKSLTFLGYNHNRGFFQFIHRKYMILSYIYMYIYVYIPTHTYIKSPINIFVTVTLIFKEYKVFIKWFHIYAFNNIIFKFIQS